MFTRAADLSGIFGKPHLYVSKAFHQAVIEVKLRNENTHEYCINEFSFGANLQVNEEGSEAAAATAAVVTKFRTASTPQFVADHPFLFAVVHRETSSIIFFGRFANNK